MVFHFVKFAYFDCCCSGHLKIDNDQLVEGEPGDLGQAYDGPYSDMSWALGMQESSRSRIYQGWYGKSTSWIVYTGFQRWTQDEWERLGEGDNLYDALLYVINQKTEFGPEDPVNNYRLKGQGSIWEILLQD
jgi:hypothetical protein